MGIVAKRSARYTVPSTQMRLIARDRILISSLQAWLYPVASDEAGMIIRW